MIEFLKSIENLGFSTWVRESGQWYGYALILFTHTMGLAMVVGSALMIDLRLLGWAATMQVKPLERFYTFLWFGFWINLASGTILLMADASTKLLNPVFYVKMVLVVIGLLVQRAIRNKVFHNPQIDSGPLPSGTSGLAWASIICWLGAITAGRLLAYLGPVAGLA